MTRHEKTAAWCVAGALSSLGLLKIVEWVAPDAMQRTPAVPVAASALAPETTDDSPVPSRGLTRSLEQYAEIAARNLFRPWSPNESGPSGEEGSDGGFVGPPPPPPPPPPDKLVLVGTTHLRGQLAAYVHQEGQPRHSLTRYGLHDQIDGGTLVSVQPAGLVVEVWEAGAEKWYYYPLGRSFAQRRVLTAEQHPEIVEELEPESLP
jgi:hypothetical protein